MVFKIFTCLLIFCNTLQASLRRHVAVYAVVQGNMTAAKVLGCECIPAHWEAFATAIEGVPLIEQVNRMEALRGGVFAGFDPKIADDLGLTPGVAGGAGALLSDWWADQFERMSTGEGKLSKVMTETYSGRIRRMVATIRTQEVLGRMFQMPSEQALGHAVIARVVVGTAPQAALAEALGAVMCDGNNIAPAILDLAIPANALGIDTLIQNARIENRRQRLAAMGHLGFAPADAVRIARVMTINPEDAKGRAGSAADFIRILKTELRDIIAEANPAATRTIRGEDLTEEIANRMVDNNLDFAAARIANARRVLLQILTERAPALTLADRGTIVDRMIVANQENDAQIVQQIVPIVGLVRIHQAYGEGRPAETIQTIIQNEVAQTIFRGAASREAAIRCVREQIFKERLGGDFPTVPVAVRNTIAEALATNAALTVHDAFLQHITNVVFPRCNGAATPPAVIEEVVRQIFGRHEFEGALLNGRLEGTFLSIRRNFQFLTDEEVRDIATLLVATKENVSDLFSAEEFRVALQGSRIQRWGQNLALQMAALLGADPDISYEASFQRARTTTIQTALENRWFWTPSAENPVPDTLVARLAEHMGDREDLPTLAEQGMLVRESLRLHRPHGLEDREIDRILAVFADATGGVDAVRGAYASVVRGKIAARLSAFVLPADRDRLVDEIANGEVFETVCNRYKQNQIQRFLQARFSHLPENEVRLIGSRLAADPAVGLNPSDAQITYHLRNILEEAPYNVAPAIIRDTMNKILVPGGGAVAGQTIAQAIGGDVNDFLDLFVVGRGIMANDGRWVLITLEQKPQVSRILQDLLRVLPSLGGLEDVDRATLLQGALRDMRDADFTILSLAELRRSLDLDSTGIDLVPAFQRFAAGAHEDPIMGVEVPNLTDALPYLGRKEAFRRIGLHAAAKTFRRTLEIATGISWVPDFARERWNREVQGATHVRMMVVDAPRSPAERVVSLNESLQANFREFGPFSTRTQSLVQEVLLGAGSPLALPWSVLSSMQARTIDDIIPVDPTDAQLRTLFDSIRDWLVPTGAGGVREPRAGLWERVVIADDRAVEILRFAPASALETALLRLMGRAFEDVAVLVPMDDPYHYLLHLQFYTSMMVASEPSPILRRWLRKQIYRRLQPLFAAPLRPADEEDRVVVISTMLRGAAHCLDGLDEGIQQVCGVDLYEGMPPRLESIIARNLMEAIMSKISGLGMESGGGETAVNIKFFKQSLRLILGLPIPEETFAYVGVAGYAHQHELFRRDMRTLYQDVLRVEKLEERVQRLFIATPREAGSDPAKFYRDELSAWAETYPHLCNHSVEELIDADGRTFRPGVARHILRSMGLIHDRLGMTPVRPSLSLERFREDRLVVGVAEGDLVFPATQDSIRALAWHVGARVPVAEEWGEVEARAGNAEVDVRDLLAVDDYRPDLRFIEDIPEAGGLRDWLRWRASLANINHQDRVAAIDELILHTELGRAWAIPLANDAIQENYEHHAPAAEVLLDLDAAEQAALRVAALDPVESPAREEARRRVQRHADRGEGWSVTLLNDIFA